LTVAFDLVFVAQRFVLYPPVKEGEVEREPDEETPLVR
jgi:hypothetical protein